MKIVFYPTSKQKEKLLVRPNSHKNHSTLVKKVFKQVKEKGDKAILEFTNQWDKVQLKKIKVDKQEIEKSASLVSVRLKKALKKAYKNIYFFHSCQKLSERKVETMRGVVCWRKEFPIESVGLYIPGGTSPLFSTVLMLAIPAKIAGCSEIILTTPVQKNGKIHPAVLYAAKICKIDKVYQVGGAQAIAALHYGTQSIPKVLKILGPGNSIVSEAKKLAQTEGTAIDMLAGPSEVLIIADESAHIDFLISDILAQLEHGIDSQAILLTTSKPLAESVKTKLPLALQKFSRKEILVKALSNVVIVVLRSIVTHT